ncbi:MAG: transcriptional regulator [Rhodospirillaceae bacterium]|nr:transcriptional regulator [Rhodospirillaceae bacterium]
MNIDHHPSEELLLDYATGALDEGWSIALATHLALCPACRQKVGEMEAIGAAFMESVVPSSVTQTLTHAVLSELSEDDVETGVLVSENVDSASFVFPEPLRGYIGGDLDRVPWQRLGLGAYQSVIPTGDKETVSRLLRIPAGKPVPTHSHGGLELTLVLCGAFSDETGHYGRGDFQEADETLEHQPHAIAGEDCICLAVTDAPLRFSSLAARMVQPFIGI